MNKFVLPFLFTYGVSLLLFGFGYHNIDLSFNMLRLENHGIKLVDESVFGVEQDAIQGYTSGVRILFISYILNLVSVAGIVINILLTN